MTPIISAMLAAAAGCSAGGEFQPPLCPTHLPPIAAVRIDEQGITRWQSAAEPSCGTFRMTDADVRRFLRDAGQAEPRAVHFTLPESACAARGVVRFADGSTGRWQIDRFAVGWLDCPGHERITLYCRRCRTRPWRQ